MESSFPSALCPDSGYRRWVLVRCRHRHGNRRPRFSVGISHHVVLTFAAGFSRRHGTHTFPPRGCRTEGAYRGPVGQALGTGIVKSRVGYGRRMSGTARSQLSAAPSLPTGSGVVLPIQKSEGRRHNETIGRAHAVAVVANHLSGIAREDCPLICAQIDDLGGKWLMPIQCP